MSESLFSPSWYRVASLKPRLRGHTQVHRHQYRGEIWFILQDNSKGQYYRFNPRTYHVIGRMDGQRTVHELWEQTAAALGDDAPTQEEVVRLMGQLHSSDVLICDVPPDTAELLRRSEKIAKQKLTQRLRSPLAIKFPLLDPDRFLERTLPLVRPFFSVFGALLWLGVVISAAVLAALHWSELTSNIVDRVLSAQNLLVVGLVYPVVKAIHELGHGYAVKTWGGECHEMGIMLLVFMPVPYVDASAASEFRSRRRRLVVGAAGILVEMLLAAVAVFVWVEAQPGLLRSVAYNTILIGSISTLLFNGNPLLRYDGYYILADLLEIPNLAKRGTGYLSYLVRRHAFGIESAQAAHTAPGERTWFVVYTIAAFIYRISIYTAIVLFLAGKFFFIGILLAIWAASSMVLLPIWKGVKFVTSDRQLREKRPRALVVTAVTLALLAVLIFLIPVPYRTRTEGVIWPPNEALVRAGTNGFIARIVAEPNTLVEAGELLIACEDPILRANVTVLKARVQELRARYDAALVADRVQARIVEQELNDVRKELARAEERVADLEIRSGTAGLFVLPQAEDLPDRYLAQGDLVAFILNVDRPTVRVVVPQSRVDLVRQQTEEVLARPAERLGAIVPAFVQREVPEAEEFLPSAILGSFGGGTFAIDPSEESGTKTFERTFQFDLELREPLEQVYVGGRVFVRFDHGTAPFAAQWYRAIRQLFLRRFNI